MPDSHVLARKFRPQTFDQVVGQEAITRTLNNALKSERIHHAYLFTGPRGVGKTTTARILAKSLNCVDRLSTTPCDACSSCIEITASRSIDVLEIDAASNTGVDNVREVIINSITIAPARDRNKIFIIDEVHMLSTAAFNALLKTLEEPPPRVVFILATTDQGKVPDTILSRCQVFEFRSITLKKIVQELRRIAVAEKIEVSDAALLAIARAGEGSMRDAESALDQVISFAGASVTDDDVSAALGLVDTETLNKTLQSIADQDSQSLVRIVDEVVSRGYDMRNFCREMMVHIRALLVVKIAGFDSELVQLPESEADTLKRLGESFSEQDLLRFFSILTKTEQDLRTSPQPRFQLEMGLVKLAQAKRLFLLEDALKRIQAIESTLGGRAQSTAPGRVPEPQKSSRASQDSRRPSTATRTAAPPARANDDEAPPEQLQADSPVAAGVTQKPGFAASSAAAAKPSPTQSGVRVAPSSPPEPPPIDDLYEAPPAASLKPAPKTIASSDRSPVDKIKAALETKRKMMVVTALDKGAITIEGDYFRVVYAPEDSNCKAQIEARDKRMAIEDATEEVLGQRLTLWASVSGRPETAGPASSAEKLTTASGSDRAGAATGIEKKEKAAETINAASSGELAGSYRGAPRKEKVKEHSVDDPKLQSLVDKFHGEVIEVIKPEQ